MFNPFKSWFASPADTFVRKPEPKVTFKERVVKCVTTAIDRLPGGAVFLIVALINVICLAVAAGILFEAAIAGIAMSVSFAMLWIGAPEGFKDFVLKYSQKSTWILDCILTVGLAVVGFSLGATLGNICLFLGLNISAMLALIRWMGARRLKENTRVNIAPNYAVA